MKSINKNDRIPLYIQLMDILVDEIENNMKENDQLPSEREICLKYDVSRTTVRQAMTELERDGIIYKEHGKGTFVAPKKVNQDLVQFYSFTEEMKKLGKKPVSKVLEFNIIEADEKLARKLQTSPGAKAYEFQRLRIADETPMMLETTYVPCDIFPNLKRADLESMPLYDIFSKIYEVNISWAEEVFRPVMTRDFEAELLKMSPELPSLKIERFTYSNNRVIEYTNTIARGDKFKYRVRLENKI
ncbi:MAG: GntR family transcriptional regulator [Tuberibacillus sp.]